MSRRPPALHAWAFGVLLVAALAVGVAEAQPRAEILEAGEAYGSGAP